NLLCPSSDGAIPAIFLQRLLSNADGAATEAVALVDNLAAGAQGVDELCGDSQSLGSLPYTEHACSPPPEKLAEPASACRSLRRQRKLFQLLLLLLSLGIIPPGRGISMIRNKRDKSMCGLAFCPRSVHRRLSRAITSD